MKSIPPVLELGGLEPCQHVISVTPGESQVFGPEFYWGEVFINCELKVQPKKDGDGKPQFGHDCLPRGTKVLIRRSSSIPIHVHGAWGTPPPYEYYLIDSYDVVAVFP